MSTAHLRKRTVGVLLSRVDSPRCLALVAALREYGILEELLTDNGEQLTGRFSAGGGEVIFYRISRENGITHQITKPRPSLRLRSIPAAT